MAVTAKWYGNALLGQWGTTSGRRVNWTGDTIKTSLHDNTETPDQDVDDFFNDVSGTELATAGGYTAGGVTLTGKTLTYDTATNEVRLDADDATWTGASFSCYFGITYDATPGTAATNPLMGYVDFGGIETVTSGTFAIVWDTTGVLKVAAA
jgi:hypothetical protein